jgi:hypothetical protein
MDKKDSLLELEMKAWEEAGEEDIAKFLEENNL